MRMLVCGGRDFEDGIAVFRALDRAHAHRPITLLIEGGAPGADRWGRKWAEANGVPVRTYLADWSAYGKAAGIIRNSLMLAEGQPDGVTAFPGGTGTADMVAKAKRAGLPVWRPYGEVR
ncbi:MAG: DUF2493 domain-containing protein [Telluria sp.]